MLKRDTSDVLDRLTFENKFKGIMQLVDLVKSKYPNEEAIAVIESTANYWIRPHDLLEENGITTLLANPLKTRIIAEARLKDDKLDSNVLADLLRANLVYESFVPDKEHRELRHLTRSRIDLVHTRTAFSNKVHSVLDKYEYAFEHLLFSKKGIEWMKTIDFLSWSDRMAIDSYIAVLETLEIQIESFTRKIASVALADETMKLLMTMPGIDFMTALTVISEIVDIRRFPTPWKLVSYAGLAPSRRDAGKKVTSGMRITKQGSRWLRFALVEAANTTIAHDERLGKFYRRIAARRGPQKARVATAKEMLVILWYMLTNMEPYRTMDKESVERK